MTVTNPKTGKPFENKITVGNMYVPEIYGLKPKIIVITGMLLINLILKINLEN